MNLNLMFLKKKKEDPCQKVLIKYMYVKSRKMCYIPDDSIQTHSHSCLVFYLKLKLGTIKAVILLHKTNENKIISKLITLLVYRFTYRFNTTKTIVVFLCNFLQLCHFLLQYDID